MAILLSIKNVVKDVPSDGKTQKGNRTQHIAVQQLQRSVYHTVK